MVLKVPRITKLHKYAKIIVNITIAAENLDVDGPTHAEIVVPREGKSRPVNFRLRGERVGRARIMVDFVQGGRPVGSVDLYPEIVAADEVDLAHQTPTECSLTLDFGQGLVAPDLVIKVFEHRYAGQPGRLHYVVSSTLGKLGDLPVLDGDFGTIDLRNDVATWVDDQLRTLGALAHQADPTPEKVSRTLAGVGFSLFEQLLPRGLQDLYWTIRGRNVRTILVLSDDPHIPWELIKPYRNNPATGEFEEDEFWGQSYALTHWLRGRPPVQRLSFNRICALAVGAGTPSSGEERTARDMDLLIPAIESEAGPHPGPTQRVPLSAEGELRALRSLEASGGRFQLYPARCCEILKLFERGEFDLLHLVAHGEFAGSSAADTSAVLMEDGEFRVTELSPRMAAALRSAAPLIFFNSCHSGRLGSSLSRLGSWGAQLVKMGCAGFVGALWPVTDRAASAFAEAFYGAMSEGRPIGEAVLLARRRVRDRYPDDPTWLAYRCFADPLARITDPASTRVGSSPRLT
jgi:hypothetical protein